MSLSTILLIVFGVMLLGNTIFGGLPGRLVTYAEAHGAAGAPVAGPAPEVKNTGQVPTAANLGPAPVLPVLSKKA